MKSKKSFIPVLESIVKKAENCKMHPDSLLKMEKELKKISDFLDISDVQALLLSVIIIKNIDSYDVSFIQVAEYLEMDSVKMLNYLNDFQTLSEKRHLTINNRGRTGKIKNSFRNDYLVTEKTVNALFTGIKPDFSYKKTMTVPEVLNTVSELCESKKAGEISLHILFQEVKMMTEFNASLGLFKGLKTLALSLQNLIAFLIIANEEFEHEGATEMSDITEILFEEPNEKYSFRKDMLKKINPIMKNKLVCFEKDRFCDDRYIQLDKKGKELIYGDDLELMSKKKKENNKNLISFKKVKEKHLFYNEAENKKINELMHILAPAQFSKIEKRMENSGMPSGFNDLYYVTPGTGKTETVLQLARQTGRNIMSIDISKTKSLWFGESEKLIKEIFDDYRKLALNSKKAPILLLNEADGILSKRKDIGTSSVAQTENAIQNIILTEMETLKGILIATTNLSENLDFAFERRFLYKIKFEKPSSEARIAIWKDKISWLDEKTAMLLSDKFDFSGGQIENIARRSSVMELLEGRKPYLKELISFCGEEIITNDKGKIGFLNN